MKRPIAAMVLTAALLLTACGKKTPITAQQFADQAAKLKMTVENTTAENDVEGLETAYAANTADGLIEYVFYDFETEETAADYFETASYELDTIVEEADVNGETSVRQNHYEKKTATADGLYYVVERVEDGIVTAVSETDGTQKKDINAFLKVLGY